jgi:hypothetical protein
MANETVSKRIVLSDAFREIAQSMAEKGCKVSGDILSLERIARSKALKITHNGALDDRATLIDLSKDDERMLSYVNPDRLKAIHERGEDEWLSTRRFKIKPAKLVRKIFRDDYVSEHYRDSDLERFTNLYLASKDIKNDEALFEIVTGQDIRYWYNGDNYYLEDRDGTLGNSCMRHFESQRLFDIYVDNPQVSMLILRSENDRDKIVGRALVWRDVEITNGDGVLDRGSRFTFMDRIYHTDDFIIDKFKDYARRKGWAYKNEQSYDSTRLCHPDNDYQQLDVEYKCILRSTDYDLYPYIDTLYGVSLGRATLYSGGGGDFEARCTEGECRGVRCYVTGDHVSHDEAIYVEHIGDYVACDYTTDNVYNGSGDYYVLPENSSDSIIEWSGWSNTYLLEDDRVWSEALETFIKVEDCVETIDGDYIPESEALLTDKEEYVYNKDENYVKVKVMIDEEIEYRVILREDAMVWSYDGNYYRKIDFIETNNSTNFSQAPRFLVARCSMTGEWCEKRVMRLIGGVGYVRGIFCHYDSEYDKYLLDDRVGGLENTFHNIQVSYDRGFASILNQKKLVADSYNNKIQDIDYEITLLEEKRKLIYQEKVKNLTPFVDRQNTYRKEFVDRIQVREARLINKLIDTNIELSQGKSKREDYI